MKIVMIDQDGVLLDKNYRTTIDLNGFLRKLPKGIVAVPNSDTPVERLAKNFLLTGGINPDIIIGEKGAVIAFGGKLYSSCNISSIKGYLKRLKRLFAGADCDIAVGDSATWIKEQKKFTPHRRMLIIDSFRRQTVGFYLRTTNSEGIACLDEEWFAIGTSMVKAISVPAGIEANDFNAGYGIVIMDAVGVSKTNGYAFLRQKFPKASFYMIGDGDADIIGNQSVVHCAVANASSNLKKVAKFVSKEEITVGLVDCLQWIVKQ